MNSAARKQAQRRAMRAALVELAGGLITIATITGWLWLWLTSNLP
jgi:hypothetical protein